MQNYTPLLPTGIISQDRSTINENFETIASNFSGGYFPTNNLFEGMRCWRTDIKKMYQLGADLVTWILVDDLSQGYNSVAHANRADYATKDADGNNIADTYTKTSNEGSLILRCYPVGSIYMSVNSTSPAELFGGSWQQISGGRVLLGASSSYQAGTTGGNETHTLSMSNIPSHNHSVSVSLAANGNHNHGASTNTTGGHYHGSVGRNNSAGYYGTYDSATNHIGLSGADSDNNVWKTSTNGSHNHSVTVDYNGSHSHTVTASIGNSGQTNPTSISNMQPYLVVYMWKRVS